MARADLNDGIDLGRRVNDGWLRLDRGGSSSPEVGRRRVKIYGGGSPEYSPERDAVNELDGTLAN